MERLERQAAALGELLGLEALPQGGREARDAARRLGQLVLASAAPPPLLSQLLAEHLAALPPVKARFVDVSTGLRLRYLEWGSGNADALLLLHDLGESGDVWRALGPRLADRGYRAIALDLRGHGESGRSLDGRYSAEALAEDIKAFIVALDLYVAPVALVGCGIGAAAALALAQRAPFLAGAVLAAEFALPAEVLAAARAAAAAAAAASSSSGSSSPGAWDRSGASSPGGGSGSGSDGSLASSAGCRPPGSAAGVVQAALDAAVRAAAAAHAAEPWQCPADGKAGSGGGGACSSARLMPWWGFRAGQATAFDSAEQCAAFLAHPLANLAPGALEPLAQAAAAAAAAGADADAQAAAAASIQAHLAALQRPLRGAVASACSLLGLPGRLGSGGGGGWAAWEEDPAELLPRIDPSFHFTFDAAALAAGMPSLRCHLLLLRGGGPASWVAPGDATAMAALAAPAAASAAAVELPGGGHWLAADQPEALLRQVVAFLEGPAIRCFERRALPGGAAAGGGGRRPELLDLKPLPQFESLEAAQKALGPRAFPTAAAVEAELRRLRVEEGRAADDASSDEEDEEAAGGAGGTTGRRHRTALAKEPADYFGFVG